MVLTQILSSYQLVRHPATLERLRQEIQYVAKDGEDLTRAQINKMTFLKCVLNESESFGPWDV